MPEEKPQKRKKVHRKSQETNKSGVSRGGGKRHGEGGNKNEQSGRRYRGCEHGKKFMTDQKKEGQTRGKNVKKQKTRGQVFGGTEHTPQAEWDVKKTNNVWASCTQQACLEKKRGLQGRLLLRKNRTEGPKGKTPPRGEKKSRRRDVGPRANGPKSVQFPNVGKKGKTPLAVGN